MSRTLKFRARLILKGGYKVKVFPLSLTVTFKETPTMRGGLESIEPLQHIWSESWSFLTIERMHGVSNFRGQDESKYQMSIQLDNIFTARVQ